MKKELEFAELDYDPNVPAPEPLKNAGLYTGDVMFDKKPWGNNYKMPRITPDATAYCSQFYAKHHIPTYNRPGNNTVNTSLFSQYKGSNPDLEYNLNCYVDNNIFG